jgi:hypothetical protein
MYKLQRKCLFGEILLAPESNICVDTTVRILIGNERILLAKWFLDTCDGVMESG